MVLGIALIRVLQRSRIYSMYMWYTNICIHTQCTQHTWLFTCVCVYGKRERGLLLWELANLKSVRQAG